MARGRPPRCALDGVRFFTGCHQPSDAHRLTAAFISIHRIARRMSGFVVGDWIMDSGAFSTILKHGGYPQSPETYAAQILRWSTNGNLLAAVTQDFMCEPHMLERTPARLVAERMQRRGYIPEVDRRSLIRIHQRWTIRRYDRIRRALPAEIHLMPVLQGYDPQDYVEHLAMYGDRIGAGAWVGVGSVCKRNGDPAAIEAVLLAIRNAGPDLRLHGFGVKTTALRSAVVRALLWTADSMAWSFAARKQGRDGNSILEAIAFADRIETTKPAVTLLSLMIA